MYNTILNIGKLLGQINGQWFIDYVIFIYVYIIVTIIYNYYNIVILFNIFLTILMTTKYVDQLTNEFNKHIAAL